MQTTHAQDNHCSRHSQRTSPGNNASVQVRTYDTPCAGRPPTHHAPDVPISPVAAGTVVSFNDAVEPRGEPPILVLPSREAPSLPRPAEPLQGARTSRSDSAASENSATDSSSYASSAPGNTRRPHHRAPWRTTAPLSDDARQVAAASGVLCHEGDDASASSSPSVDQDTAHCPPTATPDTLNTDGFYSGTAHKLSRTSSPSLHDSPPLDDSPPLRDSPPLHDSPPLDDSPPLRDSPPLCDMRHAPSRTHEKRRGASLEDRPADTRDDVPGEERLHWRHGHL
eukprot:GEMP01061369.1.p1 GENE.GEMP01061369.1~~GEMP01061369.1.p1  ORF type:complete len:282 (+),score=78.29 GEMP01061369.1:202-1047(+)